jgi:hypothetical protein
LSEQIFLTLLQNIFPIGLQAFMLLALKKCIFNVFKLKRLIHGPK